MKSASPVRHVLALMPNWLGDAAMCTPALRALRRAYPDCVLTAAGRAGVCALLDDLPWLDALFPLPEKPSLAAMISLSRKLRGAGRDITVVFPHSFRAALFAWLIQGRERIGYRRNGRAHFFTRPVAPYCEEGKIMPVYMAREYLDLVAHAGAEDDGAGLELGVSAAVAQQLDAVLPGSGPWVGIAPGAAYGPSKRWMPEAFADVADRLHEQCNARVVLITGPGEEAIGNAVKNHARVSFIEPCLQEFGIAAMKAIIAHLDLLICNDSGPRHVAIAFKRPVVCIMGPTSPRYTDSPYETGRVIRLPLPCSPCQQPRCPLEHHRCMRDITPAQVVRAAMDCLNSVAS